MGKSCRKTLKLVKTPYVPYTKTYMHMALKHYLALSMVFQSSHRYYYLYSRTFKRLHCNFQRHLCRKHITYKHLNILLK